MRRLVVSLIILLLLGFVPVEAQDGGTDCPVIVQTALAAANVYCRDMGSNQVCYGNARIDAQPRVNVADFDFNYVGDVANIIDVESMTLSGMNEAVGEWGVAILRAQANVADSIPGQNVTFVLFGDVEIYNATAQGVEVLVAATHNINARRKPAEQEELVRILALGEQIVADGRLVDLSWVRVHWPDGVTGWVPVNRVQAQTDLSVLPVIPPDAINLPPGVGQVFYFRSGIGDSPCREAPESGILIQTPSGIGNVSLVVNQVQVELGSTAYLQSQPGGEMIVNVLEGMALARSLGMETLIPAGTRLRIPVDENWRVTRLPAFPEPYDVAAFTRLPFGLLEDSVTVSDPLTLLEIAVALGLLPSEEDAEGVACTVLALPVAVDLYSGPGENYNIVGTLAAGDLAQPEAVVKDKDGVLWWQLTYHWIRQDDVLAAGACDSLPVIGDT